VLCGCLQRDIGAELMSDKAIEGEIVGVNKVTTKKPKANSIEYFEQEISLQWNKAVESIIQVGRLLHEAESALGGLKMNKLCEKLGMKTRTRQRLIQVANYAPFQDASILTHLPNSYSTLATIAQLPEKVFEKALKDNIINSESTGSAITSYIKSLKSSANPKPKPPNANFEFMSIYIDEGSIEASQLSELLELKQKIDAIHHIRSETTKRGKKYLEDNHYHDVTKNDRRDLSSTRDILVETAEQKADKEGKTFYAVTGYEKSTIYDFHIAAAVKALGGDLELFDIHEAVAQLTPWEIHEHMGDERL